MDVVAAPPFAARGVVWQEAEGQTNLTVVCKATYALRPGTSPIAREPEDINEHDNHWDDDGRRSVYAPSDLAPFKEQPEVLLVGSAYAPRGEPVHRVVVRVAVGDVDKSFEVFGARTVDREGAQTDGGAWTQMPLRYERAAGGDGSWNPVGIDPEAVDSFGRRTLPNLAPLGADFGGDVLRPVGFGPIAPAWPVRAERLGRRAASWSIERWYDAPLGDDFDGSYFQVAPDDQRLGILRADEPILLENLHPDHARFVTKLAGVRPRVKVAPLGLPPWELTLTADTLWIDTNRSICTLTWRGQVPLDDRDQPGTVLVGAEEPGKPVRWPSPAPRASTAGAAPPPPAPPPAPSRPTSAEDTAPGLPVEDVDIVDDDHDLRGETIVDDGSFRRTLHGDGLPFRGAPRAGADDPARGAPRIPGPEPRRAATRPRASSEETGMISVAPQRGSMPAWLGARGSGAPTQPAPAEPDPRPAAAATQPAPPPPVGVLLRGATPAPFTSVAAASDAAIAAPPAPPPSVPKPLGAPPLVAPPLGAPPPIAAAAPAPPGFGAIAPRKPAAPERPAVAPADDKALSKATYLGVFHASNAAAVATAADDDGAKGEGAGPAPSAAAPRTLVDVVWYAPTAIGLVRDTPALAGLVPKPPSPSSADAPADADHDAKVTRAAIGAVLARATPTADVEAALAAAATDDGALRPTAIVVAGELELPFDELERLRVVSTVAAPLAGTDKRLKETLDVAKDLLAVPLAVSPEAASAMTDRIREAWSKANRLLRPDHLDATSRRALLEGRKYQLRELFDASFLRAVVTPHGARAAVPAYLPASLAKALPLFARFATRVLAEVVPQQDEAEAAPVALRVVALGRAVPARGRPQSPRSA